MQRNIFFGDQDMENRTENKYTYASNSITQN